MENHDAHVFEWRQHLVLQFQPLVLSVYKRMCGQGFWSLLQRLTFGEVVSCGNYALVKASRGYDPSRGIKFITYASWAIFRDLHSEAREAGVVRVPDSIRKSKRLRPLTKERAEAAKATLWLDELPRGSVFEAPAEEDWTEEQAKLACKIESLGPRMKEIVLLRGYQGMTLQAIGDQMGITKERVRQLWERALEHLRDMMGAAQKRETGPPGAVRG